MLQLWWYINTYLRNKVNNDRLPVWISLKRWKHLLFYYPKFMELETYHCFILMILQWVCFNADVLLFIHSLLSKQCYLCRWAADWGFGKKHNRYIYNKTIWNILWTNETFQFIFCPVCTVLINAKSGLLPQKITRSYILFWDWIID